MLSRAAGGFLAWVPPLAVLAAGAVWLVRATEAIPHYSEPFEFAFTSGKDAKLVAHAWNVDLNPLTKKGKVGRMELREPGKPLLLAARDLKGELDAKGAIRARVSKVWGRLDREKDGSFEIEKFFKGGPPQEPSGQAFEAEVDAATLIYKDKGIAWTQRAELNSIVLGGVRNRSTAKANFGIPGVGFGRLRMRSATGLFSISGDADLDLTPVLKPFQRMKEGRELKELAQFSAGSLRAKGPFVFVQNGEKTGFQAQLSGAGTTLAFQEFRADEATFSGLVTDRGFTGSAKARASGLQGDFEGQAGWVGAPSGSGRLVASIDSDRSIPQWARQGLPADLRAQGGKAQGWVAWRGTEVATAADFQVASGSASGQQIQNLAGALAMRGSQVAVDVKSARWQGASATGALTLKGNTPRGFVQSSGLNLSAFQVQGLAGTARGYAFLDPKGAEIRASGDARYQAGDRRIDAGRVDVLAYLEGDRLRVARAQASGPSGLGAATGVANLKTLEYTFEAVASGLPLSLVSENRVAGDAFYRGRIIGKKDQLTSTGVAEAFDIETADQKLAYVRANLQSDPTKLRASRFLALGRAARATGEAELTLKTQALEGRFEANGIRLDQYPPSELSGVASLKDGILGGSLQKPILSAKLEANNVVAWNRRFPNVTADFKLVGDVLDASNVVAKTNEGRLVGDIVASISQRTGSFELSAEKLDLFELAPDLSDTVILKGGISGTLSGLFTPEGLAQLSVQSDLDRVFVNDSFLGSGPVAINFDGKTYTGSAFVGSLSQFLEAPRFAYDPAANTLDADVSAYQMPIEQLFAATRRYFEPQNEQKPQVELPDNVLAKLRTAKGAVDLKATTAGSLDNPILDVQELNATDLELESNAAGDLKAKFSRTDQVWTLESLSWTGGPGELNATGSWDEKGTVNISGDLKNLQTDWFAFLFPEVSNLAGGVIESDLFTIEGPASRPNLSAALTFTQKQGDAVDRQIDLLAKTEGDALIAEGSYFLAGFTGPLTARLPLVPGSLKPATDQPISAEMSLQGRTLTSLQPFLPWLDPARSSGLVSGRLTLSGSIDDPKLEGLASLAGEGAEGAAIAAQKELSALKGVTATLRFDPMSAILNAKADSVEGGTVTMTDVGVGMGALDDLLRRGLDAMLERPVQGSVEMAGFRARYVDPKSGPIAATLDGRLEFTQSLAEPLVKGKISASNVILSIPEIAPTEGEQPDYVIDPRFQVDLDFSDPFSLNAGAGTFTLTGLGTLSGNLENPSLESFFAVQRGFLRLPNARISIEPEGGIRIGMRDGLARADLNLTGRTAVTAPGTTGTIERYDVTLGISGNLLEANGLVLTASADPPDLSQDRILALLGQRELITGIAAQPNAASQIQAALVGLAVPYLAGSVTDQLAMQLGLDYLNVDYNAFDQFSISAGIVLGKHFTLSGRRQLVPSFPGVPLKYDVRLSYRPPFAGRIGRRIAFSIGTDQDRPWKIAVEYGIRF